MTQVTSIEIGNPHRFSGGRINLDLPVVKAVDLFVGSMVSVQVD